MSMIVNQHRLFQSQSLDIVKVYREGKKSYLHFFDGELEEYATKRALRRTLSYESDGAWVEEEEGKTRYFIEEKGWLTSSIKEVSLGEYLEKNSKSSLFQKVLGVGLGILAMAPGVIESIQRIPEKLDETGFKLLAIQQKSPLLFFLANSQTLSSVIAQNSGNITEFQVNTYTSGRQILPNVVGLEDGGFVITWSSFGQDGDSFGVMGKRYDINGSAMGDEFQINNYTMNLQQGSKLASMEDGGFLVIWQSFGQDGDNWGIYAQRYDINHERVGREFRMNTQTVNIQDLPDITTLTDGGFVVAWQSFMQDGDGWGIFGRRYDSNAMPLNGEFQVNNITTGDQQYLALEGLADGGFVVVWTYEEFSDVKARRYDLNGTALGEEFQVHTGNTPQNFYFPGIAAFDDGGFIVVWTSCCDGDSRGIFGRRFAANGTGLGDEFLMNTFTLQGQENPSVANLQNESLAVVWESWDQDGDLDGVFGQRFHTNGTKFGPEFQINSNATASQRAPQITALKDGGFVVVWEKENTDGTDSEIAAKRYDVNGLPVLVPIPQSPTASKIFQSFTTSVSQQSTRDLSSSFSSGSIEATTDGSFGSGLDMSGSLQSSSVTSASSLSKSSTERMTESSFGSGTDTNRLQSSYVHSVSSISMQTSPISENSESVSIARSMSSMADASLSSQEISESMNTSPNQGSAVATSTQLVEFSPPALIEIQYGLSYEIFSAGVVIGTFTITGGEGLYDANSLNNALVIEFNDNYSLSDGETVLLFTDAPEDQVLAWENVEFVGGGECFTAEGVFIEKTGGDDYGLLFELGSNDCELAIEANRLAPLAALLATN